MTTADYDRAFIDRPESDDPPPIRPELVDITETEASYGNGISSTRLTAERNKAKAQADRWSLFALVVRRREKADHEPKWVRLEVRSSILQQALTKICGESYWLDTRSDPIVIDSPYIALFHARHEIRNYAQHPDRTQDEQTLMKPLINFMKNEFGEREAEFDRLVPKKRINFHILWTIFRPHEEVLHHGDHSIECSVLRSIHPIRERDGQIVAYELRTWGFDYNGSRFGPVQKALILEGFTGSIDISSLEAYPLRFHKNDGEDLRQALITRGMKWQQMLNNAHCSYDGTAWTRQYDNETDCIPIYVSGRIILDYTTHQQANPALATSFVHHVLAGTKEAKTAIDDQDDSDSESKPEVLDEDQYGRFSANLDGKISPQQALIAPSRIRGFSLADKRWLFFLVERTSPIEWRKDAIQRLEIEDEEKKIIQALINSHTRALQSKERHFDDIIPGKGLGLVFLFAGDPGLGKTLTAETFAEQNQKPLYAITSGELGTETAETDEKLRDVFDRAKAWGAYLLLDEADVFLAKRDRADLARNGLVTVFLRLIEYYEGVIFLTTNRLSEFDPAFESRIQFKLFYEALTPLQRAHIWKSLLSPISDKLWDDDFLLDLGTRYELNGREIKNMIKTSLALADDDGEDLDERHLKIVAQLNNNWLQKVRGNVEDIVMHTRVKGH